MKREKRRERERKSTAPRFRSSRRRRRRRRSEPVSRSCSRGGSLRRRRRWRQHRTVYLSPSVRSRRAWQLQLLHLPHRPPLRRRRATATRAPAVPRPDSAEPLRVSACVSPACRALSSVPADESPPRRIPRGILAGLLLHADRSSAVNDRKGNRARS